MQGSSRCLCQLSVSSQQDAQVLLTNWTRSRWNWSPISWSFWPMQASVLWATGPCWGSGSIPLGAPSVSRSLTPRSPKTSKRSGKYNRKPALPVGCQRRGLVLGHGRAQMRVQSWHLVPCYSFHCDFIDYGDAKDACVMRKFALKGVQLTMKQKKRCHPHRRSG